MGLYDLRKRMQELLAVADEVPKTEYSGHYYAGKKSAFETCLFGLENEIRILEEQKKEIKKDKTRLDVPNRFHRIGYLKALSTVLGEKE